MLCVIVKTYNCFSFLLLILANNPVLFCSDHSVVKRIQKKLVAPSSLSSIKLAVLPELMIKKSPVLQYEGL